MPVDATETFSCLWQVPGKRMSVDLGLAVVDRLGLAVLEGFQSSTGRGLEVGGLLLGRIRRKRDLVIVEIEDFEPIACEHAFGPSYLLSPDDRVTLMERIRWQKSKRGPSVVGFYRSHTRKEFGVTREDVDLMANYFPDASKVLLLIRAHRDEPSTAGFVIWEGRSIRATKPRLEFPFSSAALLAGGHVAGSPTPATRPAREERALAPVSVAVARPARLRQWLQMAAGLHVVVRVRVRLPRRLRSPEALALVLCQLRKRSRSEWLAAAAILVAVFTGALYRVYPPGMVIAPASLAQLTAPETKSDPPSIPEDPAPPVPTAAAEEPAPDPTSAPPSAVVEPVVQPAVWRAVKPPGRPNTRLGHSERAMPAVVPRQFAAESALSPTPLLPDAPEIAAGPTDGVAPLPAAVELLNAPLRQIADPFVNVAIDPKSRPQRHGLLGKLFHKGTGFVPPTLVREARPELPPDLRRGLKREVPIDVRVYVDRAGKVEFAELLSNSARSNRDLASLAVFSSRKWEFSPAHLDGEAVPAEVVLRFRFGPEAR